MRTFIVWWLGFPALQFEFHHETLHRQAVGYYGIPGRSLESCQYPRIEFGTAAAADDRQSNHVTGQQTQFERQ